MSIAVLYDANRCTACRVDALQKTPEGPVVYDDSKCFGCRYRFNVSMLALDMRPGYTYFPSWMEIAVSVGLIADALLVIWLAQRFLPITRHGPVMEANQ